MERGPEVEDYRKLGRQPALDGIRAVAVLLVLCVHAPQVMPSLLNHLPHGFLGVDIFFVLSGFLITALLLREEQERGELRVGAFYRRRALRLLPAMVTLVVVYELYAVVTNLPGDTIGGTLLGMLFYYSNWRQVFGSGGAPPPGLGHMWSLAVEEQFYLVWPIVVILVLNIRQKLSTVVVVLVALIALVAVHRAQLWSHHPEFSLYQRTDTRIDSLLVGALLAHLWVRRRTPTKYLGIAGIVAVVGLALSLRMRYSDDFFYYGGFTLVAVCAAVAILAAIESRWFGTPFRWTPLRAIGIVSYGLYLWHFPVFAGVARYGGDLDPAVRMLIALVLAAGVTLASYYLIERPFLRVKDALEADDRARDSEPSAVGEAAVEYAPTTAPLGVAGSPPQ